MSLSGEKHILIFGNDHTINDFDFDLVEKSGLVTAGVNRIWKKHNCDYLYFLDMPIINEIADAGADLNPTKLVLISNRFSGHERDKIKKYRDKFSDIKFFQKYPTYRFNNSVCSLIPIMRFGVFPEFKCFFYIYGTSLRWVSREKHHFWTGDESVLNKKTERQHKNSFNRIEQEFAFLARREMFNIVSCSKDSRINRYFDYVDIHEVLEKNSSNSV